MVKLPIYLTLKVSKYSCSKGSKNGPYTELPPNFALKRGIFMKNVILKLILTFLRGFKVSLYFYVFNVFFSLVCLSLCQSVYNSLNLLSAANRFFVMCYKSRKVSGIQNIPDLNRNDWKIGRRGLKTRSNIWFMTAVGPFAQLVRTETYECCGHSQELCQSGSKDRIHKIK